MTQLTIALGQYDTGWHDAATSLVRAEQVVHAAARDGAQLVVLPEMCTTGFTMHSAEFAEPMEGPSVRRLRAIARDAGVAIVAGVATVDTGKDAPAAQCYNSALLMNSSGEIVTEYRKQRLFRHAGGLTYDGGSVVIGPWGECVAEAPLVGGPALAVIDTAEVQRVRSAYPFLPGMAG